MLVDEIRTIMWNRTIIKAPKMNQLLRLMCTERQLPWQATSSGLVLQQGAAWAHCRCEGAPGVGQPDDVHSEALQCTASRQCDEAWPSCR